MPLIECKEVSCRYGATLALDRVTLGFAAHSWTYIIGPSASGKTTLLRSIAGLQPLAAGEIQIDGRLATNDRIALPPHERSIGFLMQGQSLWPHLSSLANVALGLSDRLRGRARREEAARWLARLNLSGVAAKFPGELSGGEARGVSLARALAARPRILLLDEPTSNLDLHLRESMMTLLRELHAELQLTTLCVTHQIEPPMKAGDRVIILEKGGVLFDGAFASLSTAPETDFVKALRRFAGTSDLAPNGE